MAQARKHLMSDLPAVTKNARGNKRKCLSCELPFYDLGKSPIVCPNCSEIFVPVVAEVPRPSEPKPVSNVRRAPWSQKKEKPETDAKDEENDEADEVADIEDVDDDDDVKADDDTLLDPEAEIDDAEVVVAPKSDDD